MDVRDIERMERVEKRVEKREERRESREERRESREERRKSRESRREKRDSHTPSEKKEKRATSRITISRFTIHVKEENGSPHPQFDRVK